MNTENDILYRVKMRYNNLGSPLLHIHRILARFQNVWNMSCRPWTPAFSVEYNVSPDFGIAWDNLRIRDQAWEHPDGIRVGAFVNQCVLLKSLNYRKRLIQI